MIGAYDFCGHYEWTFAWLEEQGGPALVKEYWDEAIHRDSQQHASALILREGIEGMKKYWGYTLDHEAAGFVITATDNVFRIDMHDCPSKGFLIRNGLVQYGDYCDHCMGWIGPLMKEAGFVVDHEHNHRGQCWWEMRRAEDSTPPSAAGELSGVNDVRLRADWKEAQHMDVFARATDPEDKSAGPAA
ncbi:MAG: hypothetical protein M3463_02915 [Verrucomicrobiota bacterium]|nr:hypothetical protein [Verrucomicrobiota bacterium]